MMNMFTQNKYKKIVSSGLICLSAVGLIQGANASTMQERQQDYLSQKFGMFIHYNMSTYTDQEWADQKNPNLFAPTDLDTDQWAGVAGSAGMKYGVLTAKHHDGFCLWDSARTTYDIAAPGGINVDIVQAYTDSFRAKGMKVGIYFSIWDRNRDTVTGTPATLDIQFAKDQIEELLTNYGHIDYLWFDGMHGYNNSPWWTVMPTIRAHVRALSPNTLILVNNAHDVSTNTEDKGTDISVYEVPLSFTWSQLINDPSPAELADTSFQHWFWKSGFANTIKSASSMLTKLNKANQYGGNFLLNVGPDKRGLIPAPLAAVLAKMGEDSGVFNGQLPETPFSPFPANGSTNQTISPVLTWNNGGGATSYDIYLGTNSTLSAVDFKGSTTNLTYDAGLVSSFTTYYMRIDAVNATGKTTGSVWSFTTGNTRSSNHIVTEANNGLTMDDPEISLSSATATLSAQLFAYVAGYMTDGNTSTFMHTKDQNPSWGKIELPSNQYISWIKVFNRTGSNPTRLNNCTVKILDASGAVVWKGVNKIQNAASGTIHHIPVNNGYGVRGRSVWIGLDNGDLNGEGNRYLTIAEVKLYGTAPTTTVNHRVPFQWLTSYGITVDENVETVIEENPDGDEYRTWEEFVIGTSPVVSNLTGLTQYEMNGSDIRIKYSSVAGRIYEIFYIDNLSNGFWSILKSNIPGTGNDLYVSDPTNQTNRFYRVRVRMAN